MSNIFALQTTFQLVSGRLAGHETTFEHASSVGEDGEERRLVGVAGAWT